MTGLEHLAQLLRWTRLQYQPMTDLMTTAAVRHDWCTFVIRAV